MVKRSPKSDNYTQPSAPQSNSGGSLDPDSPQVEQGSAINRMQRLLENIFSHRGAFWLGITIAVLAFVGNCWFYFGVFFDAFGIYLLLAIPLALLTSFGTSCFQLMPRVQTATARMALHQLFVAGSKPHVIPAINPNVTTDHANMIADYRDAELNRRAFFKMCRRMSFVFEGFMGVLFIGSIGAGGAALFSLLAFAASILGVDWGVHLALKAAEDELPPHIQQQLKQLLENDGKNLSLRNI